MTIDSSSTRAAGRLIEENPATAGQRMVDDRMIGDWPSNRLLDVAQPLKALLYKFLRRRALVRRQHFLDFLLDHVNHKLFLLRVHADFGALIGLVEQYTFDLDLVRTEPRAPPE